MVEMIRDACGSACLRWLLIGAAVGAVGGLFAVGWVLLFLSEVAHGF